MSAPIERNSAVDADSASPGAKPELERLRIERRTLLKAAVAAGVAGAVYATPVVSVVPAYGATTLVSFTVQSRVICVWFSPNQADYGQWHHNENGYTDVKNNYNPFNKTMGGIGSWTCFPPAMRIGVVVNGVTRWVTFVGVPDDWIGTLSTSTCTSLGSTVPAYNFTNASTAWSGGGVKITVEDPNCEMNVTGTALSGAGALLPLGPYCNAQSNDCQATNDVPPGPPATWAAGSSTTAIGSPTSAGSQPNGNVGGGVFQTAYYHSGMLGRGQNNRCRWALLFQIRCRS